METTATQAFTPQTSVKQSHVTLPEGVFPLISVKNTII
jgi:hypothetical protein